MTVISHRKDLPALPPTRPAPWPIRTALLGPVLGLLCSCGGGDRPKSQEPPKPAISDWRAVVTAADRDRLAKWRTAWMAGIDKATAAGSGPQIATQGMLLKPDLALKTAELGPGEYKCRVIKMGAQSKGLLNYVAYPAFTCRITADGPLLRFAKIDGSQRPVGTIYPDDGQRMIFLGALMLGDETRPLPYARDAERDMAGIVERVGPARWRIAFPYPRWESLIDIIELTPKGP
jgi:hypothetical protein